ncbi:phage holin family protein [Pseudomonas oligotrophica]|uniref:phage holin family protein n=1 Tax=Pseudomonas oligotrophica TaxID=2912055 RepID=UPI001F3C8B32|nr:phage holin family protein [Pseudomonas oligotrophica]MCF7203090.1 phage holin family protein [Pseudomonas oligotrophica]
MSEQRKFDTTYQTQTLHPEQDHSVGGLLRQLTREVPALFTKELALAKAELGESLRATKAGVASVATGGAVLLAGFIVLLFAGVYGLATMMPAWLAALIVGGIVVIIGMVMVAAGKKKFEASSFKPDRTIHSLNKDKEAVRGHTS